MKKQSTIQLTLALFLCSFVASVQAQQLPLFTQYREYHGILNPAFINSDYFTYEYNISAGVSYRRQWANFADGPQNYVARAEHLISPSDRGAFKLLAGGHIMVDKTDPVAFTGFLGRIAGVFSDDPYHGAIVAGMTLGAVQYNVNSENFRFREQEVVGLFESSYHTVVPDVGLGVAAYKRFDRGAGFFANDVVYMGLSIPQVLQLDLAARNDEGDFLVKRHRHFYGFLGYYKYISDDSFIEVSTWPKYVPNAPFNIDLNVRYQLSNILWVGCGWNYNSTAHLEAGFILGENIDWENMVKIGYGFDYSFKEFGPSFGPTHEVNVSFLMDSNNFR